MDANSATSCVDRNQVNSAEQGYLMVLTKGRNSAIEAVCKDVKFEVIDCCDLKQVTHTVVSACSQVCKMSGGEFDHAYFVYCLDQQLALMIGLAGAVYIVMIESDADCERLIEIGTAAAELVNCMDLLKDARNSQGRLDQLLAKSKNSDASSFDHEFDGSIDHALNVSTLIRDQFVAMFQSQFQLFPVS